MFCIFLSFQEQKNHSQSLEQLSLINMEDIDERDGIDASSFSEDDEEEVSVEDDEMSPLKISKRKLRRLCEMGPVFRAERLSLSERHSFRNEVQRMSKAAQYLVGMLIAIISLLLYCSIDWQKYPTNPITRKSNPKKVIFSECFLLQHMKGYLLAIMS